ncbi:hypothetical protein CF067_16890 [Clostridium sporogenes]|uniref:Phage protein n=1 Tax=Clostridium botulinum B str. Osaka05 TaxID=1407017 RepID=A0A060N940_CLOBO|nr:hypothetical protein [Clostridium botulinum]BAO05133.1 phage protein [Clostridium botulinum B str. Osaka05]
MGYCICKEEGTIKIKKENMELVLKKISNFFQSGGDLRWIIGFNIEDMTVVEDDEETPLELEKIWDDLRYGYKETETHYEIIDFLGEKLGDDLKLFELIAEYCEDGYLQFAGEDGEHFRIVIKDGKATETWAHLTWN